MNVSWFCFAPPVFRSVPVFCFARAGVLFACKPLTFLLYCNTRFGEFKKNEFIVCAWHSMKATRRNGASGENRFRDLAHFEEFTHLWQNEVYESSRRVPLRNALPLSDTFGSLLIHHLIISLRAAKSTPPYTIQRISETTNRDLLMAFN